MHYRRRNRPSSFIVHEYRVHINYEERRGGAVGGGGSQMHLTRRMRELFLNVQHAEMTVNAFPILLQN